eukprot:10238943-Lingulodinium_polyedra.AAC.1
MIRSGGLFAGQTVLPPGLDAGPPRRRRRPPHSAASEARTPPLPSGLRLLSVTSPAAAAK